MSEFVNVKGLSELQKFLDELPVKMERTIMRSALREGAKVILEEAKSNVAVKNGYLRDSLRVRTRSKRGVVTASITSEGVEPRNIPIWIEYGTNAHLIKVQEDEKPTRMTRHGPRKLSMKTLNKMINRNSLVIGGRFIGPVVSHPGAKPMPFMRPALDSKAQEALKAVGDAIKNRLTKQGLDVSGVDIGN